MFSPDFEESFPSPHCLQGCFSLGLGLVGPLGCGFDVDLSRRWWGVWGLSSGEVESGVAASAPARGSTVARPAPSRQAAGPFGLVIAGSACDLGFGFGLLGALAGQRRSGPVDGSGLDGGVKAVSGRRAKYPGSFPKHGGASSTTGHGKESGDRGQPGPRGGSVSGSVVMGVQRGLGPERERLADAW